MKKKQSEIRWKALIAGSVKFNMDVGFSAEMKAWSVACMGFRPIVAVLLAVKEGFLCERDQQ